MPPSIKAVDKSMVNAEGSNQKLKLFILGSAISGAPICIGINQFASPTNAGMTPPKIMIKPCIVTNWLYLIGSISCNPGSNNSALMPIAIAPPVKNIRKLNQRYRVPISLWFVVNSHLKRPFFGP